jgi:hypothetical protein
LGRRLLEQLFSEKLKKKMNNQPQNSGVLVKFILVIQFLISLNYTLDWLKLSILFNFAPDKLQFQPWILVSSSFWSFVLDFFQFNP